MADHPLTHFTDKLLNQKVFNCAECGELLTLPVTLVENLGNVCSDCVKLKNCNGILNTSVELILKELQFPCKFNATGCKERHAFENLKEHEMSCKFFEKSCLMAHNGCNWKGVQSDFSNHFIGSHSDHVLINQHNTFITNINLDEDLNIIKLLKGKFESILKIKKDMESDCLLYTICDVKNPEYNYECLIKHTGQNSSSVETKCLISSFNNIQATKVNLSALKQITETSKVLINIKITTPNETSFDEKMLQFFECPVCKLLMKPPIYQCKFGHSVCGSCRPKLEKCANCRAVFGTTRNYSLEALTVGMSFSCMYQHLGCEETFQVDEAEKHEGMCPFKPYPCPLDDCAFRGTHSNITQHLNEKHKDTVIASGFYKTMVEFRLEQMMDYYNFQQKFYLLFDENIFRLSFKRNSDYSFWAVEVLRKKHEEDVFIYDIGIIDMRKPDRKLIRCDLCFTDLNTEELFKKCILFPNNILASYANNGMFTYYCQIRKRC